MSCPRETFTFNIGSRPVSIDRSALQEGTSDGVRLNYGDVATRRKASTILPSALRRLAKAFIEPKKEPWCTAGLQRCPGDNVEQQRSKYRRPRSPSYRKVRVLQTRLPACPADALSPRPTPALPPSTARSCQGDGDARARPQRRFSNTAGRLHFGRRSRKTN